MEFAEIFREGVYFDLGDDPDYHLDPGFFFYYFANIG